MRRSERPEKKLTTVATEATSSHHGGRTTQSTSPVSAVDAKQTLPSENNVTSSLQEIRIFLIDDHTLLRAGLRQLFSLETDITVIGEAADGFTALEAIRQLQPDVVLLDIHLPVMDGIAVTRKICQQFPQIAVIILTIHQNQQQVVDALRAGARGYLLKSASLPEVVQAIRTVYQGDVVVSPALTGALVQELRRNADTTIHHGIAQLTEKEIEIIRYLATGLSNKEIAERLAYSEKTVKNYLSVIFQKLQLRDRTQVAIFALRQGLLPDEYL